MAVKSTAYFNSHTCGHSCLLVERGGKNHFVIEDRVYISWEELRFAWSALPFFKEMLMELWVVSKRGKDNWWSSEHKKTICGSNCRSKRTTTTTQKQNGALTVRNICLVSAIYFPKKQIKKHRGEALFKPSLLERTRLGLETTISAVKSDLTSCLASDR